MDRTQKLVITLLIITVILSVASISLNVALLRFDFKSANVQTEPPGAGNVQLIVEANTPLVGGSNG